MNTQTASWRSEFSADYDVPPEVTSTGLEDLSWHNDTCPSFGAGERLRDPETGDMHDLRLWVEHPDPDQREVYGEGGRFCVNYTPTECIPVPGVAIDFPVYEGADLAEALARYAVAQATIEAELLRRANRIAAPTVTAKTAVADAVAAGIPEAVAASPVTVQVSVSITHAELVEQWDGDVREFGLSVAAALAEVQGDNGGVAVPTVHVAGSA